MGVWLPAVERIRTAVLASLALTLALLTAEPATAAPPVPERGRHADTRVITDLAYAPAEPAGSRGHLLDLYLPPHPGGKPVPLVIWSSGSAWMSDDGKAGAADVAAFFTAQGYAVAGVSVRSSTQARFPAQVHDVKAAIRWLRAHAGTYHLDPDRFAIMGNSSGGWVTSMAALTGDVPSLEGKVGVQGPSSSVQAAVNFYGPTDFLQMDEHMLDCAVFNREAGTTDCHNDPRSPESRLVGCPIQACPEVVARANPVSYVSRDDPAMLILHGQADPLVPHHQSVLLYEALKAGGNTATFFSIPGVGHEHPYVTDPGRATGHTVATTRHGKERVTVGTPDPTWRTIERFLHQTLNHAAGR